jgi:hypothetical protein
VEISHPPHFKAHKGLDKPHAGVIPCFFGGVMPMARKNNKTAITSIRLENDQLSILKTLPKMVSASILIRALLREYFKGNLPQMHAKVIEEVVRTQQNMHETQF